MVETASHQMTTDEMSADTLLHETSHGQLSLLMK